MVELALRDGRADLLSCLPRKPSSLTLTLTLTLTLALALALILTAVPAAEALESGGQRGGSPPEALDLA